VYSPFAGLGAATYFSYFLIMDILRHHDHAYGKPRILDEMIACGVIGSALFGGFLGMTWIP
jgi:hypothetical protein